MKASIIKIGNSKGVRIPKVLLEESKLGTQVDIKAVEGKIVISPEKTESPKSKSPEYNEEYLLSLAAFQDWNSPEEDEAWAYLQ
ncbi:hypothetical protein A3D14_03605 [Candidatus Saccharibacteria bacterium RIFCSPHIGHO2_02_FULL_47_12]|nr:MAG: hypothetical protein A3D14_03605 [Candidatus Saccharibacteria bacterium RIFCSPHIGHO2_02_FULL_47_12]